MQLELYANSAFQMALKQFSETADHLDIPEIERERLFLPKRSMVVSLPVNLDDGKVEVYQGFRVQHHLSMGPTKGGTRFSADLSLGESAALAIWMSWKCALANLPYGGAKGGVRVDPKSLSTGELERVSRRYMQEMIPFVGPKTDIMGPDLGTNEQVMAWFMDTYSMHVGHAVPEIVTGKPVSVGGTAGRREATGRGVAFLVERALDILKEDPSGKTAVIQGFGNVGSVAAAGLALKTGLKVIGLSDHTGCYYSKSGIDIRKAEAHAKTHGSLEGFREADAVPSDEFLTLPCDVLIPAAVQEVIDEKIAAKLRCRILAEGANGPTTAEADKILQERGDIFVIPDILCNSGGVIVSYFEWVQDTQNWTWSETEVHDRLTRILDSSFSAMLKRAKAENISHRKAAMAIGVERILAAKRVRGIFP